jgi:hypothetical protein
MKNMDMEERPDLRLIKWFTSPPINPDINA